MSPAFSLMMTPSIRHRVSEEVRTAPGDTGHHQRSHFIGHLELIQCLLQKTAAFVGERHEKFLVRVRDLQLSISTQQRLCLPAEVVKAFDESRCAYDRADDRADQDS